MMYNKRIESFAGAYWDARKRAPLMFHVHNVRFPDKADTQHQSIEGPLLAVS